MIDITATIVIYNDYEKVKTTVESIEKYTASNLTKKVFVVDNSEQNYFSENGSGEQFKNWLEQYSEDAEKDSKSIYAINKIACEQYLELYHRVYDLQYCTFRICVPYGTMIPEASSYGTAEFMLNKAKRGEDISLYGDGSVRRTLTHMSDLCYQLIKGGMSDECLNDVFNIGGEDYSLKEMAALIAEKYNVNVAYVPYPPMAEKTESGSTVFNDAKLKLAIGECQFNGRFLEWITRQ